jgi:two-component system, OmpR family, sensor kinase
MLPRGLTGRIILAFVGLSAALLVAVSATLFVVLRNLHEDEIKQAIGIRAVGVVYAVNLEPIAQWDATVKDLGAQIATDGGYILVRGPGGAVRVLVGNPPNVNIPSETGVGSTPDGYIYFEPAPSSTRNWTFVFAEPNVAVKRALADLMRALLIIVLVLLAVGIPAAWLLSRSIISPMRRLANAARELPRSSTDQPLPLEGPSEVQVLTERFNAMAHELASTRHEETQMLANLRHDLRTPLTSIGGFAEAIADGTASGPTATSAARTIAEEAQRLERLVGELGVVERLRDGPAALRPEALDADDLLTAAAARFESRAANQSVKVDVAGRAPGTPPLAFTGDRLAVERILQNLMDNALSVLPTGGTIWLRAAPLQMPGRAPGISMSVTDDGPGFPPGTSEKVFERFYRADPSRSGSGSGLGLAIVREMARAHGGEAWAENIAPHGARVTVLLPIVPAIPQPAAQPVDRPAAV